jgi:hypothetical protein
VTRIAQTVSLGLSLLLGIWGAWLLVSEDLDGGRRPMGGILLAVALLTALLTLLSLALARRDRH